MTRTRHYTLRCFKTFSFLALLASPIALFSSPLAAAQQTAPQPPKETVLTQRDPTNPWWKSAVFYQVYPRSFKDSNGDGIGDFNGLIDKLDYLKSLGIDGIWINPHYDSPNKDNGYDIRNYREVMKEYGTLADFDRLVAEMKKRDMRLMIDIVINHSSDENPWFVQSRAAKNNPYRDYYIWRDGKGQQLPNNYPSFFGGSAWQLEPATQQYYLHYFAQCQPDLNWQNPKLRHELYDMMRFWLDRGVSGLRFDSINTYAKAEGFPDLTKEQMKNYAYAYTQVPRVHDYIQEMNREVFSKYNVVTAGELFATPADEAHLFADDRRNELNTTFIFDVIRLGRDDASHWRTLPWKMHQLRQINDHRDAVVGTHTWNTYFLTNHDNPRAVSHFGDARPQWRERSAKALGTMLLTQRATPFIYQGDELGMTNYPFQNINEFQDIEVKGLWKEYVEGGKAEAKEFIDNVKQNNRDNSRTPFQWDGSPQAGFTTGTPWFPINPNYKEINAANELKDPNSVYHYYRRLIALRHATQALVTGEYRDLDPQSDDVYAYTRTLGDQRYLIAINFTESPQHYALPNDLHVETTLLTNVDAPAPTAHANALDLAPWQAGVYRLD